MKPSAQNLRWSAAGVVVAAVLAVSIWPTHRRAENKSEAIVSAQPSVDHRGPRMPLAAKSNESLASSGGKVDPVHAHVRALFVRWHAIETGDTEAQAQLTAELVALLTDANVAGIAQSLSAEELDTPFGLAALGRWMKIDATVAGAWIASRADATEAQALLVARALQREPAQFRDFCDGLPDTAWKQTLLSTAGLERVSQDPAGAIEIGLRMAPGPAQTNVLQTAAYDWMTRDPLTASAWITKVDDAALREQLLAVGTKALASTDPDLATGWLAELKSDGVQHETALCLVEGWIERDPVAAAGWVARISASDLRASAVELIARRWLQSDAGAAAAWLEKLPERDAVLARLAAESAGVDDPAEPQ